MIKFSPANAKLQKLAKVPSISPFLGGKRKVYSFDILSGINCPYARDCKSMAIVKDGKIGVQDGPHTDFRCFSASQEAFYKNVYNLRKTNGDKILEIAAKLGPCGVALALEENLPKNAGVIRIHVGGDFKTKNYFIGWLEFARRNPELLIYAYTKSLPFVVAELERINKLPNFVLTASKGGMKDSLIVDYNLRQAVVVENDEAAAKLGLEVDKDDSHAADPSKRNQSFALVIHGIQPAGSKWGKAVKANKGYGTYHRSSK